MAWFASIPLGDGERGGCGGGAWHRGLTGAVFRLRFALGAVGYGPPANRKVARLVVRVRQLSAVRPQRGRGEARKWPNLTRRSTRTHKCVRTLRALLFLCAGYLYVRRHLMSGTLQALAKSGRWLQVRRNAMIYGAFGGFVAWLISLWQFGDWGIGPGFLVFTFLLWMAGGIAWGWCMWQLILKPRADSSNSPAAEQREHGT
jgi:hypothetical protein